MELVVAEEHSQLYDLWLARNCRNLSVCHIDFHCDMRGLLIDRGMSKARYVWQNDPYMNRIDSGSFLAHAVMKGIVSELRWVHDEWGGRKYDDLYCVKYETDFSAQPFRITGRNGWVPISFKEQTFDNWGGIFRHEHLSIDWDGIAFAGYDVKHIRHLKNDILDHDLNVSSLFVCRSSDYCHPDKTLFNNFIVKLEKKLNIHAQYLPFKEHPPLITSKAWKFYHDAEHRVLRFMRTRGIY